MRRRKLVKQTHPTLKASVRVAGIKPFTSSRVACAQLMIGHQHDFAHHDTFEHGMDAFAWRIVFQPVSNRAQCPGLVDELGMKGSKVLIIHGLDLATDFVGIFDAIARGKLDNFFIVWIIGLVFFRDAKLGHEAPLVVVRHGSPITIEEGGWDTFRDDW